MTMEDDENCQRLKQRIQQSTVYFDQPKNVEDFAPYLSVIIILVVALVAIKIIVNAIRADSKLREEEPENF